MADTLQNALAIAADQRNYNAKSEFILTNMDIDGVVANRTVKVIDGNTTEVDGKTYKLAFTKAPSVERTEGDKTIPGDTFANESRNGYSSIYATLEQRNSGVTYKSVGTSIDGNTTYVQALVGNTSLNEVQLASSNVFLSQLDNRISGNVASEEPSYGSMRKVMDNASKSNTGIYAAYNKAKREKAAEANRPLDVYPGKGFNDLYNREGIDEVKVKDVFKIGDVILSVPPTHLTVTQLRTSYSVPMLGFEARPVSSHMNRIVAKANLFFTGDAIDNELKRILAQFKYCPINIIHSRDLFNRLAAEQTWLKNMDTSVGIPSVPVTMDSWNVYTVEGHPNTLGCSLQFSLFNHLPMFGGKETAKMEYYKMQFTKQSESDKVEKPALERTTHLEKALHPYNMNIMDILNDENQKFMVSDRTSNMAIIKHTKIGEDLTVENEEESAILNITPASISVYGENNFTWVPVLGFSQPTAQYIGVGPVQVSINFKTDSNALLSKLLKSYNELVEKDAFGVYDDRYMVYSAITKYTDTCVCSMKEVLTSNIQAKPGWSDVNIVMSKVSYNVDKTIKNRVAQYDPYWGLQRMLTALDSESIYQLAMSQADAEKLNIMSQNDSVLSQLAEKAGLLREIITNVNTATVDANERVLKYMMGKKVDKFDFKDMVDSGKFYLVSAQSITNPLEADILKILSMYKQSDEHRNDKKANLDAIASSKDAKIWYSQILTTLYQYNKDNDTKAREILNALKVVKSLPDDMSKYNGIESLSDPTNSRLFEPVTTILRKYGVQEYWREGELSKLNKASIIYGARKDVDEYTATLIRDIFQSGRGESKIADPGNIYNHYFEDNNPALKDVPSDFPRIGASLGKASDGSWLIVTAHALTDADKKHLETVALTKASKSDSDKLNDKLDLDKLGTLPEVKPFAGHRYFPKVDNFVKFSPIESATVGRWFANDRTERLRETLSALDEVARNSISPLTDTQAWKTAYVAKTYGKGLQDLIDRDPSNPLNIASALTFTVSRRDTRRLREVGGNLDIYTTMNPIAPSMMYDNAQKANFDVPFSGLSHLTMAKNIFPPASEFAKATNNWHRNVIGIKVDNVEHNQQAVGPKKVWTGNLFEQGRVVDNKLYPSDEVTPMVLSGSLVKDSSLPNSPIDRSLKYGIIYDEQASLLSGEKSHDLLLKSFNLANSKKTIEEKGKEEAKVRQLTYDEIVLVIIEGFKRSVEIGEGTQYKGIAEPTDIHIKLVQNYAFVPWNTDPKNIEDQVKWIAESIRYSQYLNDPLLSPTKFSDKQLQEDWSKSKLGAKTIDDIFKGDVAKTLVRVDRTLRDKKRFGKLSVALAALKNIELRNNWMMTNPDNNRVKNGMAQAAANGQSIIAGLASTADLNNTLGQDVAKNEATTHYVTQRFLRSMLPTDGLENAFPTYKLYVIQSDTSDYKFYSLDDYYDFRQVQDLMVVRNKDNPEHILRCRVVVDQRYITTDGLIQEKDNDRRTPSETQSPTPNMNLIDTEGENAFNMGRVPLRQGMRICLKLGYHSDPRALDTVFIGTITSLNGSMDRTVYDIEARGDGRELTVPATVTEQKLSGENFGSIITQMLRLNQNVVHFGKTYGTWLEKMSRKHYLLLCMARAGFNSGKLLGGTGLACAGAMYFGAPVLATMAIGAAIGTAGSAALFPYSEAATVVDKFKEDMHREWDGWMTQKSSEVHGWFRGSVFNANKASRQINKHIMETFDSGNDPVDDNIFAPDIWNKLVNTDMSMEINSKHTTWEVLQDIKRMYPNYALDVRPYGNRSTIYLGPLEFNYWRTDDPIVAMAPQLTSISNPNAAMSEKYKLAVGNIAQRNRFNNLDPATGGIAPFIPFQKHHVVFSSDNIIMNGIKATPWRGYNAVTLHWGNESEPIQMVADADIEPGSIIRHEAHVDWIRNKDMAKQYAIGLLKEGVGKLYGGTLIIRGNPKVEPYDRVFIADKVNRMFGWIEVETVIHKFDNNMGFTTHIVPNMVCAVNADSYLTSGNIARRMLYDGLSNGRAAKFMFTMAGSIAASAVIMEVLPVLSGVMAIAGLSSVVYNAVKQVGRISGKYINDKAMPNNVRPESEYSINLLTDAVQLELATRWSRYAYMSMYGIRAIRSYDWKGTRKAFKDSVSGMSAKMDTIRAWGELSYAESRASRVVKEISELNKKLVRNLADDPQSVKEELTKIMNDTESSPELKDKAKEALKKVESLIKAQETSVKVRAAGESAPSSKSIKDVIPNKEVLSAGLKNLIKGGIIPYMLLAAVEELPALLETFVIKSTTGANVISVSPLWSRYSLLMTGLEGYQNNDAFFHIKGMVLNAKQTLDEIGDALRTNSTYGHLEWAGGSSISSLTETAAKNAKKDYVKPNIPVKYMTPDDMKSDDMKSVIARFKDAAQEMQKTIGVPASVVLSQLVHESTSTKRAGKLSDLALQAYNLFGIRPWDGYTGPTIKMGNVEYVKFSSYQACFETYARSIQNPGYAKLGVWNYKDNPVKFIETMSPRYAEDGSYGRKVTAVWNNYNMSQYDLPFSK